MIKLILSIALFSSIGIVFAQQVNITRESLGSGQPGMSGVENATKWDNDIFHAPQYMPGYPTAAIIYPRIVEVQCTKSQNGLSCKGYNWTPDMGRAEYLMIRTTVTPEVTPPTPIILTNTVTVIKEVPALEITKKKIGE